MSEDRQPDDASATADAPEISVLVPVLDEAESVDELVTRVSAVLDEAGRSFEIVFVDDGSRDGTPDKVRAAQNGSAGEAGASSGATSARRRPSAPASSTAGATSSSPWTATSRTCRRRSRISSPSWTTRTWTWCRAGSATARIRSRSAGRRSCSTGPPASWRRSTCTTSTAASRPIAASASSRCGSTASCIATSRCSPAAAASEWASWRCVTSGGSTAQQIRLGSLLQRPPRPHHGPLHHQVHAAAAASLRLRRALFLSAGLLINAYLAVIWFLGEPLSNRPLLLLGVLLMVLGFQVLTTGLIGEMITFKNFRRTDSYSVRSTVL